MSLKEFLNQKNTLFKKDYDRAPLYAKWVTHKITPYVVYVCIKMKLTPNAVTAISYAFGVLAAAMFAMALPGYCVLGALFLEIYYVFDSVDGQLARYQKAFSKSGAFFDVLGNYIIQPLLLFGVAFGCFRLSGEAIYLGLGFFSAMACVWLSQIWEIQARIVLDDLTRKDGAVIRKTATSDKSISVASPLKRVFMLAHKTCTFPTLLNITTLCALLAWIMNSPGIMKYYCLYYGVVLPTISVSKLAKYISSQDADRYYESLTAQTTKDQDEYH